MKIVIDARMYGLEHAGIGRYVIKLVNEIEKLDKKNHYFILLKRKYYQKLNFKNKNFKKVLADFSHYSLKEQFLLPVQLIKLRPDLVHFPHFNVPLFWWGRQVVTIHDLIKHQSRGSETTTRHQFFYWFKFLTYRFLVWLAVKRAAKIIVPSRFWQKELVRKYKLPESKIVVIYEGVEEKFQASIDKSQFQKAVKKYKLKKPFVIYTGSLYPHKNVIRLSQAVDRVGINLVVVCARNVFWQRFKKKIYNLNLEKRIFLTGFVPDEELKALYQQAEAFVFPSLWEGFGLPGLEAMASGLPLLAARASCLPEIYGSAALYFDPHNVEDMVEKIKTLLAKPKIKAELIRLGYRQVKKYSWTKMAKQTLEVYGKSRSS